MKKEVAEIRLWNWPVARGDGDGESGALVQPSEIGFLPGEVKNVHEIALEFGAKRKEKSSKSGQKKRDTVVSTGAARDVKVKSCCAGKVGETAGVVEAPQISVSELLDSARKRSGDASTSKGKSTAASTETLSPSSFPPGYDRLVVVRYWPVCIGARDVVARVRAFQKQQQCKDKDTLLCFTDGPAALRVVAAHRMHQQGHVRELQGLRRDFWEHSAGGAYALVRFWAAR